MVDFRVIPSIEQLRQRDAVRLLEQSYGRRAIVGALRQEAEALRRRLATGEAESVATPDEAALAIERALPDRLHAELAPSLRPVLNATGVVIHTNLGRAPLAAAALERIATVGAGYCNIEYDLDEGRRGRRDHHAERLLCSMTGAGAAVVVNNNAGATLLLLSALAAGREVLISRGELVEIGGGFRVPDVMAQSGAILREVGTTNKTRLKDYRDAFGPVSSLILRVHRSNFRIEGFTERPNLDELVELGRELGIPVIEDLGSGCLEWEAFGQQAAGSEPLSEEPTVQASLRAGVDAVCFSGDKLLGGPQAGIILGPQQIVDRIRKHPLMRALRADKLVYAALEATLLEYAAGRAARTVPAARMLAAQPGEIERRARTLADRLAPFIATAIIDGYSAIGGGSAPGIGLPTRLLALLPETSGPDALEARLRGCDPPIIARIEDGKVVLDLRTVPPEQDDTLARAMLALLDQRA
jgi:L-seryl-tRNA(Ser) seleniumtransferase